jgi:hypothetical protein
LLLICNEATLASAREQENDAVPVTEKPPVWVMLVVICTGAVLLRTGTVPKVA